MISSKKQYSLSNKIHLFLRKVTYFSKSILKTMNEAEHLTLTVVGVLVLFGFYLIQADYTLFRAYVREDGFIEWLTVFLLFFCSVLCLVRLIKLKKYRTARFLIFLTLAAFMFFFAAAEEISWGQRIFGIESSNFFLEHNSQNETNIHNLVYQKIKINKLVFSLMLGSAIGLYLVVLPVVYKRNLKIKNFIDSIAVPIPRNYQIVIFAFLAILINSIDVKDQWELLEMVAAFMFFAIFLNPVNKEIFIAGKKLKDLKDKFWE